MRETASKIVQTNHFKIWSEYMKFIYLIFDICTADMHFKQMNDHRSNEITKLITKLVNY